MTREQAIEDIEMYRNEEMPFICNDALDVALSALRTQQERENKEYIVKATGSEAKHIIDLLKQEQDREDPEPLTLAELKERICKLVWMKYGTWITPVQITHASSDAVYYNTFDGKRWVKLGQFDKYKFYDHEPKEATNA